MKVGDVLAAQGKLPEALDAFQQSLAISKRLVDRDNSKVGWQRVLIVALVRVAKITGEIWG